MSFTRLKVNFVPERHKTPHEMSEIKQLADEELPDLHEEDAEEVIVLNQDAQPPVSQDGDDVGEKQDEDGDLDLMSADAGDTSEPDNNQAGGEALNPQKDDAKLVLKGHTSDSLAVAASPSNPAYVISGGMDDVGLIWDLEMGISLAKVDGANDSVSTVAFSHDGQYAALGSENGAISIVYMDGSQSPSSALEGPGGTINFLTWHPRGPVLLAGSADHVAYMWNAAKGKFLMAFAGHEDVITCGSFTADGKLVVTASHDSSLRVWNPTTGTTLNRVQTGIAGLRSMFHNADILCLSVGGAGTMGENLIATGCTGGDVFITHRETAQIVLQLPRHAGSVESLAFSPASLKRVFLSSAGADGIVRVWDVENSIERCSFRHGGVVSKAVWNDSLPVLVSASSDGSIVLWNVMSGQMLVRLTGHELYITDVCFTSDNRHVVSTSADRTVRVFDVSTVLSSVSQ